jgi:hypothetical protein
MDLAASGRSFNFKKEREPPMTRHFRLETSDGITVVTFSEAKVVPENHQPRPEAVVCGRPPRGGRLREVAPIGGEDVKPTEAIPVARQRRLPIAQRRPLMDHSHNVQPRANVPDHARRIARSSLGHTARGRRFRTYLKIRFRTYLKIRFTVEWRTRGTGGCCSTLVASASSPATPLASWSVSRSKVDAAVDRLRLGGLEPDLRELPRITALDRIFETYESWE